MGELMPILKPSGYRKDAELFFKKPLYESISSPVVAFGTDKGDHITYESASSREEYDSKLPDIIKKSLLNLKKSTQILNFKVQTVPLLRL